MFALLRPDGVHVRVIVQGQRESLQKQSSRDDEPHEPVPKRAVRLLLLVRFDEKEHHSWYHHEEETLEERQNDPRVFRFVRFLLEKCNHPFWITRENALVSFRVHIEVEDDSRSVVVGADVRKRSSALALVLVIRSVLRGRRTRGRPHRCERDDDSNDDEKSDERV